MTSPKKKSKAKSHSKPASKAKKAPAPHKPAHAAKAAKAPAKAPVKPVVKAVAPPAKPTAAKPAPPAKGAIPAKPAVKGVPARPARKPSRRSSLASRRGPGGEPFQPGDLLLPTGPQNADEIIYLLRGSVAAEHGGGEFGVTEVATRRSDVDRGELERQAGLVAQRFAVGPIEPLLPNRPPSQRRTFLSVVERAKHRRREIGAFMRGLDLGRTEMSHMDSHGEASLHNLMEWAARLENLAEADEPDVADYTQFHRGLDQLDNTTEALIIDVENTLRRLRDRIRLGS